MAISDHAARLRQAIVDLPAVSGFREYFDPETGAGYGAEDFSWTAALLIDVLTTPYPSTNTPTNDRTNRTHHPLADVPIRRGRCRRKCGRGLAAQLDTFRPAIRA